MKELIKKRHLIPIAVWFVIYMGLFGFLEIVPPKEVHLIHCALDDMIPHMAVFIYPYVSWFPYIVLCAYLAIKNLDDRQFKKAVQNPCVMNKLSVSIHVLSSKQLNAIEKYLPGFKMCIRDRYYGRHRG